MHGARRHFVWDALLEHLLLQDFRQVHMPLQTGTHATSDRYTCHFRQVHMLACGLLCCLFITLWFDCVSHCVACMSLWFVVCHSVLFVCHFVLSVYITVVVCVSLCVVCVHHCGCVCHFVLSVYITAVVCVSLCVVCVHHCGCVCVTVLSVYIIVVVCVSLCVVCVHHCGCVCHFVLSV